MKKETQAFINNLANRYVATNDDTVMSSMYKTLASEIGLKLRKWESSTYLAESHDITDLFHDAFLNSLDKLKADGYGDFVKIFMRSLHNNYKSLLRKLYTRRKREKLFGFSEEDNDDIPEIHLASTQNIEDDYIKQEEIKTDDDKRQLINVLTENCDSLTTAIVNEYLGCKSGERPTPTAIGKKLGVHHEKVKRTLRKLMKQYDERQFGSTDAYLAV
jgi:RNA polymerase sigma factor (sigma-70 family)